MKLACEMWCQGPLCGHQLVEHDFERRFVGHSLERGNVVKETQDGARRWNVTFGTNPSTGAFREVGLVLFAEFIELRIGHYRLTSLRRLATSAAS
jgi:hypothetical protein